MTRPIFEPTMERTDAALGYDKAQLQRRPAPIGSGAVQWIRLVSETTQTFGANDRLAVVYPDSITNNYPDIFDTDTTGGVTFAVLLLTTGLYQATVRVNVDAPEPPSGFSLELLGTDYNEGLSGFHSVYYPGFVSGGASFPPPNDGYPYTSSVWEKSTTCSWGHRRSSREDSGRSRRTSPPSTLLTSSPPRWRLGGSGMWTSSPTRQAPRKEDP